MKDPSELDIFVGFVRTFFEVLAENNTIIHPKL
jgi:hypothetical protein